MGSPLWDFLWDSLLFDDQLIDSGFAEISESELKDELSKYVARAAKAVPDIQTSLQQSMPGPMLAAGARLRPRQMLIQGAFYIERVVMNDPMFEVGASALRERLMAEELLRTEPSPVNRGGLAWIARYMKDLTPMVAANYVAFLPVNQGIGFAAETLPLSPIVNRYITLPQEVMDLLLRRIVIKPGTVDVPSGSTTGMKDASAVWVEFEGLQETSWYRTTSNSEPVVVAPSSEDVKRMFQTRREPGKAEWVIAEAARYAMTQAYRQIMGEVSVANLVNASYATESPLAFDVLMVASMSSEPSREEQIGRAVLDLRMPFLANVDAATLMNIRESDRDAFRTFQRGLEQALRSLGETSDEGQRRRVIVEVTEQAAAEMGRIERTLRRARKDFAIEVMLEAALASVTAALAVPASPWRAAVAAAAPAATVSAIGAANRARSQSRENDWFFLWQVQKKSQR